MKPAPLLVWASFCSFSTVITEGYTKANPKDSSSPAMVYCVSDTTKQGGETKKVQVQMQMLFI